MKNRIFMYLFVFAMLFVVFQYVNSKNILDNYEEEITKCDANLTTYKDSVRVLNQEIKLLTTQDSIRD